MIPYFGNASLILALLFVIAQLMVPPRFHKIGALLVSSLVLTSFLCLVASYISSDFSVLNVYNNSHSLKPLLYKITGTWGNHEGSMLLLILILSFYNIALINGGSSWKNCNEEDKEKHLHPLFRSSAPIITTAYLTQLILTAGFLSFLIFTSNPFIRIFPAPENGLGLNPLLQDIGLAMHPPMLYLGYIGFSVVFSFAIAALIHGKAGGEWARHVRKYVLVSWGVLTLGIGLGSWWAYRELGWGGFWFWDPVENVSLMPWLAASGLYHSLIALEKRNIFASWSILLAIITFCLSLVGIFLVRSGVVSSVHAFASDPSRGIFILAFLGVTGISAFTLFALRAGVVANSGKNIETSLVSKETMLMLNNIFFLTLSTTVLLGTIYPILLEVFTGTRVSVGAPYFNTNFNSIAILMLIITAIAPGVPWGGNKEQSKKETLKKFLPSLIVASLSAASIYIAGAGIFSIIAIIVAIFLLAESLKIVVLFTPIPTLRKLPRRVYAMALAHCGAAILVIGITITCTFGVEKEQVLSKGQKLAFAGYEAVLVDGNPGIGKNYLFRKAHLRIFNNGDEIANLYPEIRIYPVESSSTIEADIHYTIFSNIYAAIGEIDDENERYTARIYYKPMVNFIWLGCIMMTFGGLLAAFERKGAK